MDPDHELTCYIDLPGGRRVEVGITVIAEPLFPTPNEPDIVRAPALHEWADICRKLATLQFSSIKTKA
jgi:hypothetical protein